MEAAAVNIAKEAIAMVTPAKISRPKRLNSSSSIQYTNFILTQDRQKRQLPLS
jgi:hypothetical protein